MGETLVQGINLIPQDNINACWWASTLMMYEWQRGRGGSAPDPRNNSEISTHHRGSNALPWAAMRRYATAVGMTPKPLMTPTIATLTSWLQQGPLWTDGVYVNWRGENAGGGHVVVVAGVREVQNSDGWEIYIYDPWPVNIGQQGWRPISHLVAIMEAGGNPARNVVFMSY